MNVRLISQKFFYLLTSEQRLMAGLLLILIFFGMILETIGIGLIIPAITLMTQSDIYSRYPVLQPWLEYFGNPTHNQLIIFGLVVLSFFYVVKALFLAYLAWKQIRFPALLKVSLSERLFNGYLHLPYTFHLQRNSSELIRNISHEASVLTVGLSSALTILSESIVFFGIAVLLLYVEPVGALLAMSVFGIAGFFYHGITRGYIKRWGESRQFHEGLSLQHLMQGLAGVKDVKLLGRETSFLEHYHLHNVGAAKVSVSRSVVQALPRIWLELLAVLCLALVVIVMINRNNHMDLLLPILGLFAAVAFRVIPLVNRLLSSFQTLLYTLPAINTVYNEFQQFNNLNESSNEQSLSFCKTLELDNVTYKYPEAEKESLTEVSLRVNYGDCVGFIGTTGAGKSTLVDVILGLLPTVIGSVKVDDVNICSNLRSWQSKIGYVAQSIYLTDDSLRQNIAFGLQSEQINDDDVWRAIRYAQLDEFINDLPDGLDTVVGERGIRLSGGQRQRIGIARALYHDPSVLVLDEATSSLDTETEKSVMKAVREMQGKKTILIVAHRLSTVESCDYIYRLEQGRIVEDGIPDTILYKQRQ